MMNNKNVSFVVEQWHNGNRATAMHHFSGMNKADKLSTLRVLVDDVPDDHLPQFILALLNNNE